MNFLPGASLPVLARGRLILEVNSLRTVRLSTALLSLDVADEVGLFTVLPFFQRKLDRTRPSSHPSPPPPPSSRHPPWRRLPNEKARAYLSFFLASVNCIFWSHLGCSGWKANIFYPCRSTLSFVQWKDPFQRNQTAGDQALNLRKKRRKKKPTSEVSRAGFTPFFLPFFSHSEAWSQAMKAGTLV